MNTGRTGGYIPAVDRRLRKSILISVKDSDVTIGAPYADDVPLGFNHAKANEAAQDFINVLSRLSDDIVGEQRRLNRYAPDYEPGLERTLRLDDDTAEHYLRELRAVGAPLRADLNPQAVERLGELGFGFLEPGRPEAPLTFIENATRVGKTPILWEMMHEENTLQGPVDWKKFWGFGVPITYWVFQERSDEIKLERGLFSAVDEGLGYAGREINLLAQRLGLGGSLRSLDNVLKERITQELEGQAMAWDGDWLKAYLAQLEEKGLKRWQLEDWKNKTWVTVFKDPPCNYGVVHFACHCDAGQGSEFLSRLDVRVAGEPLSLTVALMATEDMVRGPHHTDETGPLVFLNACESGKPNAGHQPPGFPLRWINNQGALAVLVTLCPVPDYFAYRFAEKFYSILAHALRHPNSFSSRFRYVSRALTLTRSYFMNRYQNPLGMAYVLYGVRDVRVVNE